MKTFGYLLMAVMACMTCSCRDEEPLPDPVPPVVEPENPGNPEEPDTGKVYWKSHSTLTLLATQDLPTFLYYMIDPLKSWCWGAILFYPFKNSRFS